MPGEFWIAFQVQYMKEINHDQPIRHLLMIGVMDRWKLVLTIGIQEFTPCRMQKHLRFGSISMAKYG